MEQRMPIIVSLIAGVLAIFLVSSYVEDVRQQSTPSQVAVAVATRQLRLGTVLEAKDVVRVLRDARSLPKLAVKWAERTLYFGQEVGFPVIEGDYLLASYFGAEAQVAARLSEKVDAQGQRAITIPVDANMTLEGSVRPGDRLDLLISYRMTNLDAKGREIPELVTSPLLENVYVIATGRYGAPPTSRYSTMTLLLNPDQGKLLTWASKLGELSVMLRNQNDLRETDRAFLKGSVGELVALGRLEIEAKDAVGASAEVR